MTFFNIEVKAMTLLDEGGVEKGDMEALKIMEKKENLLWDYDAEADVLYISIGNPIKAEGVDIGKGVIVRVDTESNEIVGFTIIHPLKRTLHELKVKVQ